MSQSSKSIMTVRKELLDAVVRKHYNEIADPTGVDGAQMWDSKWWMPLWGCDTLQTMLEDLEYILRNSADTEE